MSKALISSEKIHHVHDHLTPLAIILVVPGLIVADIPQTHQVAAAGLLIYSILLNTWTARGDKDRLVSYGRFRVASNYVVNIVLLWILYAAWPLSWLLMLLMGAGVAVYQKRERAFGSSLAFAAMLLAIHGIFGDTTLFGWVSAATKAGVLVMFTLFINGLPGLGPWKERDEKRK